jgi:hypothetical protein
MLFFEKDMRIGFSVALILSNKNLGPIRPRGFTKEFLRCVER